MIPPSITAKRRIPLNARFAHTNIISSDWRSLAGFYCKVFGCVMRPPERDLSGEWVDELTGLSRAHLRGAHILLPGYGDKGPTLEIFQYDDSEPNKGKNINREGFSHIAFAVDDVDAALESLIANGGSSLGKTVQARIEGAGSIQLVYAKDPEGNIIELQKWG